MPAPVADPTPLLVLDVPPSRPVSVASGLALQSVSTRLANRERGVFWFRGRSGSGKSTLLHRALERLAQEVPDLLGILRIECWPGLRLEEALSLVGEFLAQVGVSDYAEALLQRTPLPVKIELLFRILEKSCVWLWLDDFQNICGAQPRSDQSVLQYFVAACQAMRRAHGKLLLVTEHRGPEGLKPGDLGAEVFDLAPESIVDGAKLHQAWREHWDGSGGKSGAPPEFEDLSPELARNPLALRLIFHDWPTVSRLSARGVSKPLWKSGSIRELSAAIWPHLDRNAQTLVDLLSAYRRPMSHGTLRALISRISSPAVFVSADTTIAVEDLRRWGLLEGESPADRRLQLHPALTSMGARRTTAAELAQRHACHDAIARHHLEIASKTRSLWDLYGCYRHLRECGSFQESYEVQKTFLERFLTIGFHDLAKTVLEECLETVKSPYREVVCGNLSIIYKSEGNLDRALELYRESLAAFSRRGDLGNACRVYHQIGNTHFLRGDEEQALQNYRRCLDIAERIEDDAVSLMAKIQVANIQFARKEFDEALAVYREALPVASAAENSLMVTALNLQIAQVHMQRHRYSEAEEVLRDTEAIARAESDLRHLVKILQLRGIVARKTHDPERAFGHFVAANEISMKLGDPAEQGNCLLHLATVELERQQHRSAVIHFLEARELVQRLLVSSPPRGDSANLREVLSSIDRRLGAARETIGEERFRGIVEGRASEG